MDGRAHNVSAVLRLLLGFVVLSTVAGLLMAGLAIPAVGATGQAAKGGVDFFNDLPERVHRLARSPSSRASSTPTGSSSPTRTTRTASSCRSKKISKNMQNAQIAIEDARFYEHGGLDVRGFSRAMISNLQGGDVQGASTLTQQFVKITLQENALRRGDKEAAAAAVDKTYSRKLQELKYALNVEENFTKDQILEGYLNLVYYGDQAYGVEAAALNYFGVSAAKLTLGQAALLAGIVQQPTAYNPVINPKAAQARRNLVLDRMQALGHGVGQGRHRGQEGRREEDDQEEAGQGRLPPVVRSPTSAPTSWSGCRSRRRWRCSGKTPADRLKAINQGGLTIRTTLKPGDAEVGAEGADQGRPDGQQAEPCGRGDASSSRAPARCSRWPRPPTSRSRRPTSTSTRSTAAAPSATSSGRPPRRSPSSRRSEKGMPLNGTIKMPFATGKKGRPLHRQRSSSPRSAAPTSRGRSGTTTPAAARR